VGDDEPEVVRRGKLAPNAASGTSPELSGRPPETSTAATAQRPDWVPWLIALIVFAAYSVISISYYVRLDPGSPDLAIFTEYVKQYAHLRAPVVDVRTPGLNLLGDHFHPIVALIAPFFRIAPTPVTLLVAQALLVAVSVIPVSRAATAKLGTTAGRVIAVAYGFSWGLQWMIDFDFHELAFAVPLLAFSLSALLRGRTRAAAAWALPLVFVKEDQGFTVAAIGVVILIDAWRARARAARENVPENSTPSPPPKTGGAKAGLFLVLWGIAWSAVSIEVIIPFFNPDHQYDYWQEGGVLGGGGRNSITVLLTQLAHGYPQKLGTLALILLPVAFLALRSPLILVAVPSILLRFLNTDSSYWGFYYHYNAPLMPIVFIAAIDALSRIQAAPSTPGQPRRSLAVATVRYSPALMLAIAAGLAFWAPLKHLRQPQTYTISQHVRAEDAAMAKVPGGATVEATVTMLASLAARTDTFRTSNPGGPAAQYIVFDNTKSINNPKPGNIQRWVEHRHQGVRYRKIYSEDDVYVFRRS
jgi:uncharacterized membrane protein